MGTRNLTCVVKDGEYKVAQYCQWDGYPEGQGQTILNFLRGEPVTEHEDMNKQKPYGVDGVVYKKQAFLEALDNCHWATEQEVKDAWGEAGSDGSEWVSFEVSKKMQYVKPQYSRDMGAMVLPYIQKNGGIGLKDEHDFAQQSLWCEWAYVVDYDTNKLEVYEGFVKAPHTAGRFAELGATEDGEYYPVALVASWDLDDLPTVEDFIEELSGKKEEE